jgi:hypothetical protein
VHLQTTSEMFHRGRRKRYRMKRTCLRIGVITYAKGSGLNCSIALYARKSRRHMKDTVNVAGRDSLCDHGCFSSANVRG